MIKDAIRTLSEKRDLTETEARNAMEEIMGGTATGAQIAAFLTALRVKGETAGEIYACASVVRDRAERINVSEGAVDMCGTGGDCSGTFNISTTAAFVVAGAGITVAKHGNRSVSSRSGSADLLEELGIRIDLSPEDVERCVRKVGIGFLFAPLFHGAMKHAAGPRREIGIRTVFNVIGPLTNPAGVKRQVLGVYDPSLTETLSKVLMRFGAERALVVHGSGLDEFSTAGKTKVSELLEGKIRTYHLAPEDFGLKRSDISDLLGGSPKENAEISRSILKGEKSPRTDIVLLNSAAAIYLSGKAGDMAEGLEAARESIDSGRAMKKLEMLAENTMGTGGGKNGP